MSSRIILCSGINCLTAYQEAEAPEICENIECQRPLFGPTGSGVVCLRDARVSRRGFTANAVTNNTSNASAVESTSLYCDEAHLVDEDDVVVEAAVVEDNEDDQEEEEEDDADNDADDDADDDADADDEEDEDNSQEDADETQEDEEELQAADEEPEEDEEELQAADEEPEDNEEKLQVDEDEDEEEEEDSSEPEDPDDAPIRYTPIKGSQVVRVAPNAPVKPVRGATRLSKVRAIAAIDVSAEQDEKPSDEDVTAESMLDNWATSNSRIVEV